MEDLDETDRQKGRFLSLNCDRLSMKAVPIYKLETVLYVLVMAVHEFDYSCMFQRAEYILQQEC